MTDTSKAIIGGDLKSMHIAVYALSLLGGTHTKVHTEDIAVKCIEIAPSRFRPERYDYPDGAELATYVVEKGKPLITPVK